MDNIIVKDLEDGYFELRPKPGYRLYNTISHKYFREAVTKTPNVFCAVAIN